MKRTHPIVKVTVVLSSALLVSGLICYRAGAFDWLVWGNQAGQIASAAAGSEAVQVESAQPKASEPAVSEAASAGSIPSAPTLLPGSKAPISVLSFAAASPPKPSKTSGSPGVSGSPDRMETLAPSPSQTSESPPGCDPAPVPAPQTGGIDYARFDWVEYYKKRGYKVTPTMMGGTKYAPVFVSPMMQWALSGLEAQQPSPNPK
jgi:hypothetical protein